MDKPRLGEIISGIRIEVSEGLSERIFTAIELRERKSARLRSFIYSAFSGIFAVFLYFTVSLAGSELSRNGTLQLLSLVFSDFQSVIINWKDFGLSVAESLPLLPMIYVVVSVLALVALSASAIINIKKVRQINNYLKHA
jgi:hypothetical protein